MDLPQEVEEIRVCVLHRRQVLGAGCFGLCGVTVENRFRVCFLVSRRAGDEFVVRLIECHGYTHGIVTLLPGFGLMLEGFRLAQDGVDRVLGLGAASGVLGGLVALVLLDAFLSRAALLRFEGGLGFFGGLEGRREGFDFAATIHDIGVEVLPLHHGIGTGQPFGGAEPLLGEVQTGFQVGAGRMHRAVDHVDDLTQRIADRVHEVLRDIDLEHAEEGAPAVADVF